MAEFLFALSRAPAAVPSMAGEVKVVPAE
jgi:hypothetical protein